GGGGTPDDTTGGGPPAWALRQVAFWGACGMLLYAFVGNRISFPSVQPTAAPAAQSAPATQPSQAATNTLTYRADQRGHVVLEAVVNGAQTRFLVDTGASFVALTPGDAAAAGIGPSSLSFNTAVPTANGAPRAAPISLREVRIGQLPPADVQAMVVENLNISLLGQSFLKRLDGYEMREGVLTIPWQ